MTVRVPAEVQAKLARLARSMHRSRSYLAAKAVTAYGERELAIVEGIMEGLADVAAGRTMSNDDVMAELHAIIDVADRKRAAQA